MKTMETAYTAPQIEVIEIEFEGVLCDTDGGNMEDFSDGTNVPDSNF